MKIGDMVVCTNDDFHSKYHKFHPRLPKKGEIFFVRGVYVEDQPGIYLEEILSSVRPETGHEQGFAAYMFRVIKTPKIDVFLENKVNA